MLLYALNWLPSPSLCVFFFLPCPSAAARQNDDDEEKEEETKEQSGWSCALCVYMCVFGKCKNVK